MHREDSSGHNWGSRTFYLLMLVCQSIGLSTGSTLPSLAITDGALGNICIYVLSLILLGIPMLYMEMIVSQFTSRDCIELWSIRPFLSHVGYFLVGWQLIILLFNHCSSSFTLHYLIISFETNIPYYQCGRWTDSTCNAFLTNYTLNEDCLRSKYDFKHCEHLHKTFPPYQYWNNYILRRFSRNYLFIAWQVCLSSVLLCITLFLCCFRREKSMKSVIWFLALYPSVAHLVFLIGCFLQKGVVTNFSEAINADFSYNDGSGITHAIVQSLYTLTIGSGLPFNLAASGSFRSPCYANAVITAIVCVVFTVTSIVSTCLSLCPFAYEFSTSTTKIANIKLTLMFEKMPILLNTFEGDKFWLLLLFSSNTVLALRTTTILFFNIQELFATRFVIVSKYPAIFCFFGVMLVFVGSIPLLSNFGMTTLSAAFRQYMSLISLFMLFLECLVFVVWYGINRFSEDVHFMLGMQPSKYLKIVWVGCLFFFAWVFLHECSIKSIERSNIFSHILGTLLLSLNVGGVVLLCLLRLAYAAIKGRFREAVTLDSNWGPQDEILKRSRTMFNGQAMTKEYIYRQYHIHAGIVARQRRSNKRNVDSHQTSFHV